jgi:DHA1 family tetracycline resistance protein-like MFS transporter
VSSKPRKPRQAAVIFIFVTLVLDSSAGAIAYPVFPKLIGQMTHADAAHVAEIFGVFGTLFFVMQFFAAPVQGTLADAFGRRPVILISSVGMALDYVIMALAPDVHWLYLGRAISGITAGSIAAATAYLIDVTPVEDRTRIFGLAGAAASVGTAFGPALGGLAGEYDLRLPFWIAAGLSLISAAYGWFVLPESLKPENRVAFALKSANPVSAMHGVFHAYPVLLWWALISVLYALATMGVNSIFAVYTSFRYGWSPRDIGFYLGAVGVWSIVTQALLLPVLIKRMSDRQAMILGSLIQAVAIVAAGLVSSGIGYAVWALIWIVGLVLDNAATNTLVTAEIGASDQGRVQGAFRSLNSVTGLFAPGLFALLLAQAIRDGGKPWSGGPYILSGVMVLVGLIGAIRVTRKVAPVESA